MYPTFETNFHYPKVCIGFPGTGRVRAQYKLGPLECKNAQFGEKVLGSDS